MISFFWEVITTNERIKLLRLALKMNQEEFGRILGLTKSGISSIESGQRSVTEKHIIMLRSCSDFNVNENWLRFGQGDMFDEMSADEELVSLVASLTTDDNELKKLALLTAARIIDNDICFKIIEKEMLKYIDSKKE